MLRRSSRHSFTMQSQSQFADYRYTSHESWSQNTKMTWRNLVTFTFTLKLMLWCVLTSNRGRGASSHGHGTCRVTIPMRFGYELTREQSQSMNDDRCVWVWVSQQCNHNNEEGCLWLFPSLQPSLAAFLVSCLPLLPSLVCHVLGFGLRICENANARHGISSWSFLILDFILSTRSKQKNIRITHESGRFIQLCFNFGPDEYVERGTFHSPIRFGDKW